MDGRELEQHTQAWIIEARALAVRSGDDYERAASLLLAVKQLRKALDEAYDDNIADAHRAHKKLLAKKASFEQPLIDAERQLKARLLAYDTEQRRIRAEEERKLREEARKIEEEARLKEAERLENEGRQREAEAVLDAPSFVPAVKAPPATPKVEGVSYREIWSAEVDDLVELCRGVADGTVPSSYVTANMTAINQKARAERGAFALPGCRAVSTRTVAAGGRL